MFRSELDAQTTMTETRIINIADDFSPTPGGRYAKHGPASGEEFRNRILKDAVRRAITDGDTVIVRMDGTAGYGGSFLEEAFGGLIRKDGFSRIDVDRVLKFEASPVYRPFRDMALRFIKEARPEARVHA